ncbi:MAG: CoA transferase subunit A [Actinobacteria bacterium]|nr:CoA transferase subunit A [Actinomycetota bacterium]
MADKRCTADDVVARLESGMTIGIGGWGARRKPMSIVRAILRSDLTDLTVASFGGPDVGMLCAAGKVTKVVFAFVSLDTIPLEPHFRAARQSGAVAAEEYDEGQFLLALQAAAWRVPFLPTRVGLGSDVGAHNPRLATVTSPFPGPGGLPAEELIAVPALELDAALVHYNVGDARGNAAFTGPDQYFDDLMLEAAPTGGRFVSVERIVPTAELRASAGCDHRLRINRMMVDGVVEAPNGAHPTSCDPDYGTDEAAIAAYAATAKSAEAWDSYRQEWLTLPDETAYQSKLRATREGRS